MREVVHPEAVRPQHCCPELWVLHPWVPRPWMGPGQMELGEWGGGGEEDRLAHSRGGDGGFGAPSNPIIL